MKKKIIFILFICLLICSCNNKPQDNPIVTMEIKDYGEIKIELYPDIAPNTVANFVNLVEAGFYNNNTIHRLAKGFVLQGGDPTGTGKGGPNYTIEGEFELNGFSNKLSHTKGIVSMARGKDKNSAGSQFFIVLSDNHTQDLDGRYAAFGEVIDGMDIIGQIENADLEITDENMGILKEPLTIKKTIIDTKGYKYKVKKYR